MPSTVRIPRQRLASILVNLFMAVSSRSSKSEDVGSVRQRRAPRSERRKRAECPFPKSLHDGGGFAWTGGDPRGHRPTGFGVEFRALEEKNERHRNVAKMALQGFDSRRLHPCRARESGPARAN